MALDVHLKRMGNSTWEFRLVGKKGFNISVTEAQVPDRRRKLAVQEPVYTTSSSSESSEEDSQASQHVTSGLYDPVLDDTEVIYETIGPADSDQPLNQQEQPTEVEFEIKQFTDQPDLTRSLTSSPFPIVVKPYRPFSTEPLEIPPIEDPIILNPNYKDVYASQEFDERPPETRFKLPISAQYDPKSDPTKETVLVNNKIYVVEGTDMESKKTSDEKVKMVLQVDRKKHEESIRTEKEEHKYIEKMKKEIDLGKIEATAFNLVDESMQQAVTIAEEIKKEIDVELKETVLEESNIENMRKESIQTNIESNVTQKEESVIKSKIESSMQKQKTVSENETLSVKEVKESEQVVNNLAEIIDKTTNDIIKQKESIKIEINEAERDENLQKDDVEKVITKEETTIKSDQKHHEQATSNVSKESGTKITASNLLAEQRAYTIGLQTIPNIRGSIQSSNHYNLLLKTFFVHLTDVMVALSRFILTEPVLTTTNKGVDSGEAETNIKTHKQTQVTSVKNDTKLAEDIEKFKTQKEDINMISYIENKTNNKSMSLKNDQITTQQKVNILSESNEVKDKKHSLGKYEYTEDSITDDMTRHELQVEEGELIRKRKLSGSKIAQIEGRKSADLTDRMDKVISEFQRKSGTCEVVNNVEHIEDHIGSRSRSEVEEEHYHENISSKSISYIDSEKKSLKNIESQSENIVTESSKTHYESRNNENVKTESNGKLTYVAIVEAHVYTNKDAIFEEQMRRMSESSKTETSAFESVNKMSVIKDSKEESVEELLLAKNIESSTKTSLHKSVAQAHAAIETPMKTIAAKTSVALEEEHKVIQKDQLISKKSHVVIEKPVKTLAEKSETVMDENVQVVDIPKIVAQSPKQVIVTLIKTVAEVKEVFVEEEKAVTIETPVLNIEKPKCTLDATIKAVAQKTEVLIDDNTGTLEANLPIKPPQQAKVIVNESVAAVVTEISPLEESKGEIETPKVSTLKADVQVEVGKVAAQASIIALEETGRELNEKPMLKSNQANLTIEESIAASITETTTLSEVKQEAFKLDHRSTNVNVLIEEPPQQAKVVVNESVAAVITEISPLEESKGEIETPKVSTLKADVQVEVGKVAAQASIIALEETGKELNQKPMLKSNQANITIEESMATSIAETTTVCELQQEAFKLGHRSAKVNVLIEEPVIAQAKVQEIKVEDAKCEITDVTDSTKNIEELNVTEYSVELPKEENKKTLQEESAALKIVKQQIIEVTPPVEVYEDFEFDMKKIGIEKEITQSINIHEQSSNLESSKSAQFQSASSYAQSEQHLQTSEQSSQSKQSTKMEMQSQAIYKSAESSVAVSGEQRKLTLCTNLMEIKSEVNGAKDQSPSPPTVPPTPLVDEYIFKLEAPLPKNGGPPVPRDCSVTPPSEHEDLGIVKKKLVPQIVDTNIEQVIYDPPLPTPTSPEKKSPPKYVKPGLRGGSDRPEITKEEIMEIERKSSLLTSAIDETIRSIEEYKESVGIEMNQEIVQESLKKEFSSEVVTEETMEENGTGIVSNGYVEEDERNYNGSEGRHHEVTIVEETQNHEDESEQSIVQTIVLNGSNGKSTNYEATTNGDRDFNEKKNDDVVETVTINLSKIKRDSLQESTLESKENNEQVILNGDIKYYENNKESNESNQYSRQSERTDIEEVTENLKKEIETKTDPLQGYRSVEFNPEAYKHNRQLEMQALEQITWEGKKIEVYKTDSGEIIGSQQGIIDGLEEPIVDPEIAKELGKPGMPEEKIAELISGEAEMLREAHVMGLARVLKSHMHRTLDDDCSVDFKKIKPYIESLKDSEVLKALNEEILRSQEEKKKEERKWTTFLQKPVAKPKQKIVFCGNKDDALNYDFEKLRLDDESSEHGDEPYRVKIVKQPKPRIAPDFKPEDFDTGPLPWEQRAIVEEKEAAEAPPVEPEEPILIPEDVPEFVEAVDPLPESEVPDLEDTGIPLPPSPLPQEVPTFVVEETQDYVQEGQENKTQQTEGEELLVQEEAGDNLEEMDKNKLSEQLMTNIESMVDPNATLEEQLAQMRAQLATLAQLPNVIQQTLELVTKQISQISQQKTIQVERTETVQQSSESREQFVDAVAHFEETQSEQRVEESSNEFVQHQETREEQEVKPSLSEEEQAQITREEQERLVEEQKKLEQQKKELIEQMRIEQESRLVKQRSTPRVGKPRPMFGPPVPMERPVVLPGGRKWRKPEDAFNEQQINEALTAQAEVIKGKAIGVNFMKYEKPPVSLDHLQQSEVYKVVHNMDQTPLKRVEMLTPVIAEADYRERARSATPCSDRMEKVHFSMPQQLQP